MTERLGASWYGFVNRYTAEAIVRLSDEVEHSEFVLMEDGGPEGFYLVDINTTVDFSPTPTTGRVRWLPGIAGTRDSAPEPFSDEDRKAIFERVVNFCGDPFGPRLIRPWEDT